MEDLRLLTAGPNRTPAGELVCGQVLHTALAGLVDRRRMIYLDSGGVRTEVGSCVLEHRGLTLWATAIDLNATGRALAGASRGFYLSPALAIDQATREIHDVPYLLLSGRIVLV